MSGPRWLTDWHADPAVLSGLVLLAGLTWVAVRRLGPGRIGRARLGFLGGSLGVLVLALCSPLATYADERFSVHMVQHLLLIYVAAPLLALAAPVTLALQASSETTRRRVLLPALHSRAVRVLSHPVVTWVVFAAVMYVVHFSDLYDASLGNPFLHGVEHLLFLSAAALFWWPVVRRDPVPGTFPWPARLLYLLLAMPYQSLLGLAIFSSGTVLYAGYEASLGATAALDDQHLAGAVMWVGGDVLMLVVVGLAIAAWMRDDARRTVALDQRLDAARAAGS